MLGTNVTHGEFSVFYLKSTLTWKGDKKIDLLLGSASIILPLPLFLFAIFLAVVGDRVRLPCKLVLVTRKRSLRCIRLH